MHCASFGVNMGMASLQGTFSADCAGSFCQFGGNGCKMDRNVLLWDANESKFRGNQDAAGTSFCKNHRRSRKPGPPPGAVRKSLIGLLGLLGCYFLLEYRCNGVAWTWMETYSVIPAMLFMGATLSGGLTRPVRNWLIFGAAFLIWFAVTKALHRIEGVEAAVSACFSPLTVCVCPLPGPPATARGGGD